MTIYRSIVAKSSAYSVSLLIGRLVGLLLMPVYTRSLSTADYGILELLDLTLYVFGVLVAMQLGESLIYFYSMSKTDEDRNAATSTAILTSLGVGVVGIGALLGISLSGPMSRLVFGSSQYTSLFYLAFFNLGFSVSVETAMSWFRARNQATRYAVLANGRIIVGAILNVVFLIGFRMGVASIQWSSLIASGSLTIALSAYILRQTGLTFSISFFKQQFRFAAPFSISGLFMLMLHYGDRFFLQRTVSLSEIGIYSVAYKFGMMISLVQTPFSLYWTSQVFTVVREENGARIYVRVFTYLCLVVSLVMLLISLFIQPVIYFMAAPPFRIAAIYVPLIALAYLFRSLGDFPRSVLNVEKKTSKYITINASGGVTCMVLYAILIPRFGLWGAVIATVIGFFAYMIVSHVVAQRVRRFELQYGRCIHVLICTLICVGANVWLNPQGFLLQTGVGLLLFVAWWLMLAGTGFFDEAERRMVGEALSGLRKRLGVAVGA